MNGAGLRPGTHLAVVAVDNQGVAPHLVPRPVALQPGTVQLGQAAARLIQQAIQGSAPGDTRFDPVISDGVFYIRHGKALMAYDIRKK